MERKTLLKVDKHTLYWDEENKLKQLSMHSLKFSFVKITTGDLPLSVNMAIPSKRYVLYNMVERRGSLM